MTVVKPVQTCLLKDTPHPTALISGGYQSMYGLQAGGTHPTGMLFCCDMDYDICYWDCPRMDVVCEIT